LDTKSAEYIIRRALGEIFIAPFDSSEAAPNRSLVNLVDVKQSYQNAHMNFGEIKLGETFGKQRIFLL